MGPMGFRITAIGWLILAICPAGQLFAAPVEHGQVPMTLSAAVCVPPGLPPFAEWAGGLAELIILQDEAGRPVLGVSRVYSHRGAKITTIWVGSVLVSVDPAPEDREARGWHDRGAVTVPATILRERPVQACDWFKPLRRTPPEGPSR